MDVKNKIYIQISNEFRFDFVQILTMLLQHMQTFLVLSVFL